MKYEKQLREYAKLTVKYGVNVQPGQYVSMTSPVCAADFALMVQEEAYAAGASDVYIQYSDIRNTKVRYLNTATEVLTAIPQWQIDMRTNPAREGAAQIHIIAEDPEALVDVSSDKLLAYSRAAYVAYKEYYDLMDAGVYPWTIVAYPCLPWAKKVFPGATDAVAMDMLMKAILKSVRIGRGDAMKKWRSHDRLLKHRAKILNDNAFVSLHFTNSIGTDLTVGLVNKHIWQGGSGKTVAKNKYFANMPTEEIFTMPDMNRVDGKVVASMPLSYQGALIDGFSINFENGAAVNYSAGTGYETLKRILETDEGSKRLGEVALIPYKSPISDMKILFYNTLFDENASCHLALGSSYPETVAGGEKLDRETLKSLGANDSAVHVDFMFGTSDMKVVGRKANGEDVPVFENGNFVF